MASIKANRTRACYASSADKLRDATTALEPDARARTTNAIRTDGTVSMVMLAERHAAVSRFELSMSVPLDIRVHFETAKNLYLYACFVYRFYPVAEQQALATLEFALRERLAPLFPDQFGSSAKRHPSLSTLFAKARNEKLITNVGLRANERLARNRAYHRASMERIREMQVCGLSEMLFDDSGMDPLPEDYAHDSLKIFAETLPFFRNTYAHGSSMLHSTVLGTFESVISIRFTRKRVAACEYSTWASTQFDTDQSDEGTPRTGGLYERLAHARRAGASFGLVLK